MRGLRSTSTDCPHINDAGTMYLAATDSPLFDDAVALTLEHLDQDGRQNFEAVYGQPPSMRGFRDLLCLHELAHTYHSQAGFLIEPLWLMEFFCNITLQGFLRRDRAGNPPPTGDLADCGEPDPAVAPGSGRARTDDP